MKRYMLSLATLLLVGAAASADPGDVAPTRAELFDRANAANDAPAAPSTTPPLNPALPVLKECKHDVTLTGAIGGGLRLDLELQYLSLNRFKEVIIGGIGLVREPEPKMLRPGVTYKEDGTYEIKFSTFQKSWLGAKYQLHYARIGLLKAGAAPTYFDLRADAAGAPGMFSATRIAVKTISGALSADVQTQSGPAPHRILALPDAPGWTAYTINVEAE